QTGRTIPRRQKNSLRLLRRTSHAPLQGPGQPRPAQRTGRQKTRQLTPRLAPTSRHLAPASRHLDRSRAASSRGAAERPLYYAVVVALAIAVAVAVAAAVAVVVAVVV